ncbi:MAG TPA: ATP-binding protein [Dehalococcoidia bacterium]|nr:ATP-binding protein [Dehalococcoidia bacterium]
MVWPRAISAERSAALQVGEFLRRLPLRLRERHFWFIQATLIVVTVVHYGLEATGSTANVSAIHHIPVTLYLIAVVYAGIHYGFEGGIMTALGVLLLTVPSIVFWHRATLMWVGEVVQLTLTLGVGAVIAWRVELEATYRRQAEATSRRLALLHDVSSAATQTLKLDRTLNDAVRKVADALESGSAWVAAVENPDQEPTLLAWASSGAPGRTPSPSSWPVWKEIAREVSATGGAVAKEGLGAGVPLVADGKLLGVLGVGTSSTRGYAPEDLDLLTAMANSIAVAIDNARLYRDELNLRHTLRAYAAQVTRAQEEERSRIARELHDDTVQSLVQLCRELDDTLAARAGRSGECKQCARRLADARTLAQDTLEAVRRFSRDLRPSVLDDLGLIPAIEWLVTDLAKRTGVSARFHLRGEPRRLSAEGEILLFRIVQEALRNVEKHAQASTVDVTVECDEPTMTISVRDDGRGFRVHRIKDGVYRGQLGLLGMQERAHLLGAALDVMSRPGAGTEVTVRVSICDQPASRPA